MTARVEPPDDTEQTVLDEDGGTGTVSQHAHWFRAIVERVRDVIVTLDSERRITWVTPSVAQVLGYRPENLIGRASTDFIHLEDLAVTVTYLEGLAPGEAGVPFDCRYRHANGQWRILEVFSTNQLNDPIINGIICTARDVTDLRAAQAELEFQAGHDPLTGLANRRLFFDLAEQALARAGRERTSTTLLFLDLDHFKTVNDDHGHLMGDRALQVVAHRINAEMRAGDVIGRLGGDEFAVLCERTAKDEAGRLRDRLVDSIVKTIETDDAEVIVGVSVGIAVDHLGEGSVDAFVPRPPPKRARVVDPVKMAG